MAARLEAAFQPSALLSLQFCYFHCYFFRLVRDLNSTLSRSSPSPWKSFQGPLQRTPEWRPQSSSRNSTQPIKAETKMLGSITRYILICNPALCPCCNGWTKLEVVDAIRKVHKGDGGQGWGKDGSLVSFEYISYCGFCMSLGRRSCCQRCSEGRNLGRVPREILGA